MGVVQNLHNYPGGLSEAKVDGNLRAVKDMHEVL